MILNAHRCGVTELIIVRIKSETNMLDDLAHEISDLTVKRKRWKVDLQNAAKKGSPAIFYEILT